MKPRNAGELVLTRLKSLGVDCFFANPGTEFASIIRGFHELPANSVPKPVMAPHESLATGMAYGHYLSSGRAQAVMTHANVGAANALIGLMGAARMNIPLIFISGMTSRSEHSTLGHRDKLIHWAQDSRDQGAIFREYVKFEAEISDASMVTEVLDRAHAIAMTPPYGPVAIKMSRDILLSEDISTSSYSANFQAPLFADLKAVDTAAKYLSSAKKPIVITNRLGADPSAVACLIEFSQKFGVGVLTPDDYYVSFPSNHSHHLGYRPSSALAEADFVLVLDTDAPWYPLENGPNPEAKVVHAGPDPYFRDIPLRSHRGDLFVQTNPGTFLSKLSQTNITEETRKLREAWLISKKTTSPKPAQQSRLNAESVSTVIAEFIDSEHVLINELGLSPAELKLQTPGTYFRSGSASPLGWGVGAALGLRLADSKKLPIAAIGDGVFFLSPMLAALQTSAAFELPFVSVVLNNGGMNSITQAVTKFYPEAGGPSPLSSFTNEVEYEKCASIVGGLALRAQTTQELHSSIQAASDFCKSHRKPVVINAIYSNE